MSFGQKWKIAFVVICRADHACALIQFDWTLGIIVAGGYDDGAWMKSVDFFDFQKGYLLRTLFIWYISGKWTIFKSNDEFYTNQNFCRSVDKCYSGFEFSKALPWHHNIWLITRGLWWLEQWILEFNRNSKWNRGNSIIMFSLLRLNYSFSIIYSWMLSGRKFQTFCKSQEKSLLSREFQKTLLWTVIKAHNFKRQILVTYHF